jgi:hypothetical protein
LRTHSSFVCTYCRDCPRPTSAMRTSFSV